MAITVWARTYRPLEICPAFSSDCKQDSASSRSCIDKTCSHQFRNELQLYFAPPCISSPIPYIVMFALIFYLDKSHWSTSPLRLPTTPSLLLDYLNLPSSLISSDFTIHQSLITSLATLTLSLLSCLVSIHLSS